MYKKLFFFTAIVFLLLNTPNFSNAQSSEELVVLHTQSGKIVIELFSNDAPQTVDNFVKLANEGFYDDTIFHRIIQDFMIQGGDPLSKQSDLQNQWGTGNAGYNIQAEFNTIEHNRGIVSMARSADPNSASSQFFIVHKDSNFLDEQYTIFGRIATQESFETLDRIAALETGANDVPINTEQAKILKAEVKQRSEIPDLLELGQPERVSASNISYFDGPYIDEKFGFSLITPQGWQVQQLQKTTDAAPDVAIVGPVTTGINPVITINVVDKNGRSLDQRVDEINAIIESAIDDGSLEIIIGGKQILNGTDVYIREAVRKFETGDELIYVKYRETIFSGPDKFYTLTYSNAESDFQNQIEHYDIALSTFEILAEETSGDLMNDVVIDGGGCLIATATFGSEMSPQVQKLREIRDNGLLKTDAGSAFMEAFNQLYYSFSPTIADLERESPLFKEAVKLAITPLLTSLSILNYVEFDSEETVLGFGISLILLNVGMYFIAPTIILSRIFKRQ